MGRLDLSWRPSGLWNHHDFRKLWAGQTVSVFGSLISRTAIPFAAIIELNASPFQMAILEIAEMAPAFAVGLFAGVWVDRLRRRSVMIAADLGRALLLLVIPVAAIAGVLQIWHLFAVMAGISILSIFFDVAYQSYLPGLVGRARLVEGNSKLAASASVSESAAFSVGGWLVQLLTAPIAIFVNAFTFLASAAAIWRIVAKEVAEPIEEDGVGTLREAGAGLSVVWRHRTLRGLVVANTLLSLSSAVFGTAFLLYLTRDLGYRPGLLGLIFAIGGVTSLIGAIAAGKLTGRFNASSLLACMLVAVAIGQALVPLVGAVTIVGVALLIAQQLIVDPAWTVYEIAGISLRQSITSDRMLGRVNASFRVLEFGGLLVGALVGGSVATLLNPRAALVTAFVGALLAVVPVLLWVPRSGTVRRIGDMNSDATKSSDDRASVSSW
jgi:MFS family permease